jgi:TRAP-type C4-dicarboxylate transport system permease small subunit
MTGDRHESHEPATIVEDGVLHLDEAAEAAAIDVSDIQWDDVPAFLLFWALALVVFAQFFTRYVLNDSLGWTEEIARYLLIGVTFIGAVIATRKGTHIAIEMVYAYLPRRLRQALSAGVDVVLVGFYAWLAWQGAKLAMRTNSLMVSIELPKSIIYWSVAVGFAGMALYQLWRLVRHIRTGTSPLIDPPVV